MLDLNTAGEQKEGTGGAIPPKSIVPVRLTIRTPKVGSEGSHPLLTRSSNGLEYLNCEFEVMAGRYAGRKIWENLGIFGITDGQKKNVEISLRKLRAILEAVRGVRPDDQSPAAVEARKLQNPDALQGMLFGVKVGVEPPKAGDRYVNNTISRIITPDHEIYAHVMNGEELITDEPVPAIPQAEARSPVAGWAAPGGTTAATQPRPTAPAQAAFGGWGGQQQPAAQVQQGQRAPQAAWAQPQGDHRGPAFPSDASGMDDVPFR